MRQSLLAVGLLGGLAGCATSAPAPPVELSRAVAVLPPHNRTGDPLVVSGASLLDRYVRHAERATVGDVLLSEARFQLEESGIEVVDRHTVEAALKGRVPESPDAAAQLGAQAGLKDLLLYLEIRRWEPDAPMHTTFVIVALSASLVDPGTGEVVWQGDRRAAPVPTPGEIMVESAYVTAARKVMEELLAPLRPAAPAPAKP